MFIWKQMCQNARRFDELHEELISGSGRYILEDVQLPDTCRNLICTIEFRYYAPDQIILYCLEAPVDYVGTNPQIARWLWEGKKEFGSFHELTSFLLQFGTDSVYREPRDATSEQSQDEQSLLPQERPRMRYDGDALTVPDPYKGYIRLDKERLYEDLTSEIFGQESVLEMIVHEVYCFLGMKGKDRPLSLLLYGTSGTGKTETAVQLVEMINRQLPKDAQRYIYRDIDCTHFTHQGDISRLTGAAPGFVGHDEDGPFAITEDNPYVVFAINEVEKAHSEVATALMEAMDTGRMATNGKTLPSGRNYYSLSNCIVIFTSNITIDDAKSKRLGFSDANEEAACAQEPIEEESLALRIIRESNAAKEKLVEAGAFRKEVLGRMTAVLKFSKLSGEAIIRICAKSIENLAFKNCKLCITEIDTPILQEFIDVVAANSTGSFGARNPKLFAGSYFGEKLIEFSHKHPDYTPIRVSGSLDDICIDLDETYDDLSE
ncbi:MAG: ATP-dependent Clp protease ATP-binding subunit [Clostridia bacterium]|nr:ATP-dependent Clp protease ATP-binding subunit [Clostridia bacterium]